MSTLLYGYIAFEYQFDYIGSYRLMYLAAGTRLMTRASVTGVASNITQDDTFTYGCCCSGALICNPISTLKCGERCVRDISVMTDYAVLGAPADAKEVRD
uniref:Protein LAZ1 homolog 1 n=1 Tax=Tanacetum cinerariifolium TaxID=118510 RepID=A0A699IGS0_TANCI|nr:protein LAZ1 homolog 1 [Tanacetum cinerariifolium]